MCIRDREKLCSPELYTLFTLRDANCRVHHYMWVQTPSNSTDEEKLTLSCVTILTLKMFIRTCRTFAAVRWCVIENGNL